MRLEIITFLTHMILLRGWEPPGYRRGYSRKGHLPCVRGRCTSSRWGGSGSVHVCWFMCVLGKYPVCFQFYRTKCQSRKLRHVIFCNICIKNPNLRIFCLLPLIYKEIQMQKLATPYDEGVASFEPICGMPCEIE